MRVDRFVLFASRWLTVTFDAPVIGEEAPGAALAPDLATGGGVAPSPAPPIFPCPFWARTGTRLPANKKMISCFIMVISPFSAFLIGPHTLYHRAQIDSNPERDCIE